MNADNHLDDDELDEEIGVKDAAPAVFVSKDWIGSRIDQFAVAHFEDLSRAEAQRLIETDTLNPGGIRVNGLCVKSNYRVRAADTVTLARPAPVWIDVSAEAIPLDIVYEDRHLLVINKARGMVVHPAPGSTHGTLVNAVLGHAADLSGIGGELRPGIVHRLDKDTGGLLVVAKTDSAHRSLQAQIQAKTAERKYLALLWGVPSFKNATIEAAIGRHPTDRKKMAVITDHTHTSRAAITDLALRESFFDVFSLWEAKLHTGRTHQIRVHCAYIKHPIVADSVYGGLRKTPTNALPARIHEKLEAAIGRLCGQALHAYSLAFNHPETGERMAFTVPAADCILDVLDVLREG